MRGDTDNPVKGTVRPERGSEEILVRGGENMPPDRCACGDTHHAACGDRNAGVHAGRDAGHGQSPHPAGT